MSAAGLPIGRGDLDPRMLNVATERVRPRYGYVPFGSFASFDGTSRGRWVKAREMSVQKGKHMGLLLFVIFVAVGFYVSSRTRDGVWGTVLTLAIATGATAVASTAAIGLFG